MASNIPRDYTGLKGDWAAIPTIPDFAILVSPVIDMGEFAHVGSRNSLLGENASAEKIKRIFYAEPGDGENTAYPFGSCPKR